MKVRELILHIGPIPIAIPRKLFLDLLRDPVFPRGLTDSQSYIPIFINVDSWANSTQWFASFAKMGTYDWLSDNPRGNTESRRRSTNKLTYTMGIGRIWGIASLTFILSWLHLTFLLGPTLKGSVTKICYLLINTYTWMIVITMTLIKA